MIVLLYESPGFCKNIETIRKLKKYYFYLFMNLIYNLIKAFGVHYEKKSDFFIYYAFDFSYQL